MVHNASRTDHGTCADGHSAADRGVRADPDILFDRDRGRCSNAPAALLRVKGMTGASQTYPRCNERTAADVYWRSIQDHAVVVDEHKAMGMDIEPIIAVKIRLDADHGRAGAEQFLKNRMAFFVLARGRLIVFPA